MAMSFLKGMSQNITEMGQKAVNKTKDLSESVRISGAIREEKEKQDKLYQQIGRYMYENHASEMIGEMKEICTAISMSNAQIVQYEEQLRILKGTVVCPGCGAEIAENSSFCNNCGTKIERKVEPVVHSITGRCCVNCGSPLEQDQRFCSICGTKAEEEGFFMETEQAEEFVVEEPKNICSQCGNVLEVEATFCTSCGAKIEKEV